MSKMEDKRSLLLEKYQKYNLSKDVSITGRSLEDDGREFLSSVNPEERYIFLNLYPILVKTAQNFERNENSIQKMKTGFNCLEKYAVNLWKFPWRKEYHTIKLYTAFFKGNIQQKLQDTDAILTILNCLGYKAEHDPDRLSLKEPNTALAIRVSLELFLVQLDLQVIKEIMENVPESKLALKDMVKVRERTFNVKDACEYLSRKITKRQKLDTPSEGDSTSDEKAKEIQRSGRKPTVANSENEVVSSEHWLNAGSADRPDTSGTEGKVVNVNHLSAGFSVASVVAARVPSDCRENMIHGHFLSNSNDLRKVSDLELYGLATVGREARHRHSDFSERVADTFTGGYHSLPHHSTGAPRYLYSAQSHAHFAGGDIQGLNVDSQGGAARCVTSGLKCTNAGHPKTSSRNDSHQQGLPLVGWQDIGSPANQQFSSRESSQLSQGREVTTEANDSSAEFGTNPEPMDIDHRGHNRLQNNFSYSKEMTERVYNRRKTESGVADLKDTLQYNLTLENESYKKPSSTREAPPSKVATTRVGHICGREVTGIPQPSRPAVQGSADYGTSTRTSDGRGYVLDKTAQTSLSVERPIKGTQSSEGQTSNEMVNSRPILTRSNTEQHNQGETRSSQIRSEGPSKGYDRGATLSSLKKDHRVEGARINPAFEATASSLHKYRHSDGATASASKRDFSSQGARTCAADTLCNHCMLQGQLICKRCLVIICKECQEIFETNLCDSTKGKHVFQDFEDKGNSTKTAEMGAMSNQERTANGKDEKEWNCSRCTYLNSPEHGICVICATTRGVDTVEISKAGSRVCQHCTLHNDEGAKVCVACHKTFDRSETFV